MMFVEQIFRVSMGLVVLLFFGTQVFGPPEAEKQIVDSIKSTTAHYRDLVESTVNETMKKMLEKLDSNGDGYIQLEELRNHATNAVKKIRSLTPRTEDVGKFFSFITWAELFWRYFLLQLMFLSILFIIENTRDLIFPGPRKLLLDNSYLTNNPPEVGPEIALTYDTPWTTYEKFKLIFFTITGLLFLRIIILFSCGIIAIIIMSMSGWKGRNRRNNPIWFNCCTNLAYIFAVLASMSIGMYHIKIFGRIAAPTECKILLGNHSCIMEVVILFVLGKYPSFVTRKENCEKVPFFADLANALEAITVDRDASESRRLTAEKIRVRAKDRDPNSPQIAIFPEGTTANQRALFMFKKGAMVPGEPVQMVCITFPYKHFNPCWTGRICGGSDITDLILRLCIQFVNRAEVRILPVYTPTDEERKDACLYAKHCQKMMATVLQCGVSSCTYNDYLNISRVHEVKSLPTSCDNKKE